jgi:hypothetical protein
MRHALDAIDLSDRLLACGAIVVGAGLAWLIHPAWLLIVVGMTLIGAGVLRDLAARAARVE